MKIQIEKFSEKGSESYEYRGFYQIEVDDIKMRFLDGEPEDANLGRDFNDIYKIKNAIQKAYEAGKNGESLDFEEKEVDDLD